MGTFTLLGAFRGDCLVGVGVFWRVGIKNLGYRKFLLWYVIKSWVLRDFL